MKKKIKLLISLAGFCLSLAVFAFGVIAGVNVAYVAQGVINYEIEDSIVSIETRVYSTSKKFNSQEDFEQTAKIIEHSDFATLNAQTTLDEEYDFKSVQIKNTSTPSAFSETNPDYVDKYTNRDNPTPPTDLVLDLDYEYKSNSRTMAYFVVIKVTNESPFTVYTQVKTTGEDGDDNIYQAPENSYIYKTAKIEILEPVKPGAAYPYTYICFAMGIEDAGWEMDDVEFNYPIIVNQDDPRNSIFDKPYVAQVENVFSQTTEGETQISSTGSTLTNVPVSTYMGAIGYSILNLVLPTTTQATSDVVITLSMSLSIGGQTENLTALIETVALIPIKCSTIDECLANEGNALQIVPELSSDQTYYTITIPTSVLSSTRTDLTVLPLIDVDMAAEIESAQIGVDYILSTTQEGVAFNAIKTITEWGMVDYKKMGEEFIDPINVDVTTVSLGTDSISFSASLRNFQLRNIPENSEAIDITFTSSDKVQAVFVMNEQKEVITIMDMMMVLEGAVESISGLRDNTTTINFPITATEDGTMDFYICLFYYQTIVSDGEEIPLTVKVEFAEIAEAESPLLFELNTDSNFNLYYRVAGVKDSTATDVSVPAYYKNLPVKEINSDAFQNNATIQNVTFEEGAAMTSIQSYQFTGCTNLQSVTFGENVQITSIGSYAFQNCSNLKNFEIPASVTTIYSNAFAGSGVETITFEDGSKLTSFSNNLFQNCTSLKTIEVPVSITSIGSYAFSGCTSLSNVIFEEPSSLTTINSYAFQNCTSLTSIDLPSSVTTISSYAFSGCTGLIGITIPENVTNVGSYAFQNCTALQEINWNAKNLTVTLSSSSNIFYNVGASSATGVCVVNFGTEVQTVPNYLFYVNNTSYYPRVTQVNFLGENITTIGNYAFQSCTSLLAIEIPRSVTTIGDYAFNNCTSLTTVTFDDGTDVQVLNAHAKVYNASVLNTSTTITTKLIISNYAFQNCTSLTNITIPDYVIRVGDCAFQNCTAVQEINWNIEKILFNPKKTSNIFYNVGTNSTTGECIVNFGENVQSIPNYLFYSSNTSYYPRITQVNFLGDNISIINTYAFNGCKSLKSLVVPDSVEVIGTYAFQNCTSLTTTPLTETSQVYAIGTYAFDGCTGLTKVIIPSSLKYAYNYAFQNCTGLTEITLNSNQLQEAYQIFNLSGSTTNGCVVNFGDNVTSLPREIFRASNITEVNFTENIIDIGYGAFYGCTKLTVLDVPAEDVIVQSNAFYNCTGLTSITFNSITTYKGYSHTNMFYHAGSTTEGFTVTLKTENALSYRLFENSYISNIILLKELTYIDRSVFKNCIYLTEITIPDSVEHIYQEAFYGCTGLTKINYNANIKNQPSSSSNIFYQAGSATNGCVVSFGENVTTIPTYLFNQSYISNVTISSQITEIGDYAFANCTELKEINYNTDGISELNYSSDVFYYSGSTTNGCVVNFGENVTNVPEYLFNQAYLSQINLNNVEVIGTYAFANNIYLTSVTIPSTVNYIAEYSFGGCTALVTVVNQSQKFYFEAQTSSYGDLTTNATTVTNEYERNSITINGVNYYIQGEEYLAYGLADTTVTDIVFDSKTTAIIDGAFKDCTTISKITIPESVVFIGNYAFQNCTGLTEINYNSNSVGDKDYWTSHTFEDAGSIENGCVVNIGNNVKRISEAIFYNSNISKVTIPESITEIKEYTFGSCSYLTEIYFNTNSLQTISSSSGPFRMSGSTTNGCKIVFGENVTVIPNYLCEASNISEVILPKSLETIGIDSFSGCEITSIEIPNTVISIGNGAFSMTNLSNITIPNSVKYIGEETFKYCLFTTITIPQSVEEIDEDAFIYCQYLEEINYEANAQIDYSSSYSVFYQAGSTTNGCVVNIGPNVRNIPNYLFKGSYISQINISSKVKSISNSAFQNCTYLTTVVNNSSNFEVVAGDTTNGYVGQNATSVTNQTGTVPVPETWININGIYYEADGDNYIACGLADTTLTSLVFEANTVEIGSYAFNQCSNIVNVTFPDSLTTIGNYAFYECTSLSSIDISGNITTINDYAFYGCSALTTLTIPNNITDLGVSVFGNCSGLTQIYYNNTQIETYEREGSYWSKEIFEYSGSESGCTITFTDELTFIPGYAIAYSYITDVVIPDSVIEIKKSAFISTSKLKNVTFGKNVETLYDFVFTSSNIENVVFPDSVKSYGYATFRACSKLKSVTLSKNATTIVSDMFENCTSLESIDIPDNIETIGSGAFSGCTSLTNITIPSSVVTVGSSLFEGCTSLTSATILGNITKLDSSTFKNCTNLTTVSLPESLEEIDGWVFENCSSLININIPNNVRIINSSSFKNCTSLSIINLPNNLKQTGYNVFENCTSLTSITIPESVTSLGDASFKNCTGLREIYYNSNYIEKDYPSTYNFEGAGSELGCKVYVGDNVKIITQYLFRKSNITEVEISSSVQKIDYTAFYDCTKLKKINIPESVIYIGSSAFYNCTSLIEINYNANILSTMSSSSNTFRNAGSTTYGCKVYLGNNVSIIPAYIFYYSNISEVEIPRTVTMIETYAFQNCSYLKKVVYAGSSTEYSQISIASYNNPLNNATKTYLDGWVRISKTESTCTTRGVEIYEKDGQRREEYLPLAPHNIINHYCTVCGQEILVSATITETAAGSSYGFIGANGTYTSNNQNKHSTSAIAEISTQTGCTLTINWTVSSESGWDKLYIYLNGSVQSSVNGVSGSQNGTLTLNLVAGDVVQIKYQKDGSASNGSDCATFTFTYQ